MKPLVSIVMPAFNAEKYLYQSVESLLTQTYTNIEIIIIDDGSTDRTFEICNALQENYPNIKYIYQTNSGISSAINHGILHCSGEFIARMDSDDISLPSRIATQVEFLQNNASISLVSSSYIPFLEDNASNQLDVVHHPSDSIVILLLLSYCSPICHPAVMVRAEVLKSNMYSTKSVAEDHELWCSLSINYKFFNISEPLLLYRLHSGNLSRAKKWRIRFDTFYNGLIHFWRSRHEIARLTHEQIQDAKTSCPSLNWKTAYIYWAISCLITRFENIYSNG